MGSSKLTVTKQLLLLTTKHATANIRRIHVRKLCENLDSVKTSASTSDRFKSFIPFDEILESRRAEARRSIIVQVKERKSYASVLTHCLNYGAVRNTFFYSLDLKSNFVVIEYDDIASSEAALDSAASSSRANIIPVRSPFLWFRFDLKGEKKIRTDLPELMCETNELPSVTELERIFSESYTFADDMMLLFNRTKLTETAVRLRYITALQVENAFKGMLPVARIIPFGSSTNSFGKVNCDLDLATDTNSTDALANPNKLIYQAKTYPGAESAQNGRFLETMADVLQYFLPGCANVRRIFRARVPIIKYKQEVTGIDCDLSGCNNMSGAYMSELLYLLGAYDWRVRPLVFTVRYWAKEISLTNPAPGKWITNFSLSLLVLFFLQREKIIPTLDTLTKYKRPQDSKFIDDNECGFLPDLRLLENSETINNDDCLFTLLCKFFEFYSTVDLGSYALSLNAGTLIVKPLLDPLYIVNPLEKGLNVSRNVSAEERERLRIECRTAAWSIECSLNADQTVNKKWGLLELIHSRKLNPPMYSPRTGMKGGRAKLKLNNLFENDFTKKEI